MMRCIKLNVHNSICAIALSHYDMHINCIYIYYIDGIRTINTYVCDQI